MSLSPVRFAGRPEFMDAMHAIRKLAPHSKELKRSAAVNRLAHGSTDPKVIEKKQHRLQALEQRRCQLILNLTPEKLSSRQKRRYEATAGKPGTPPKNKFARAMQKLELLALRTRMLATMYRQAFSFDVAAGLPDELAFLKLERLKKRNPEKAKAYAAKLEAQRNTDMQLYNQRQIINTPEHESQKEQWLKEFEAETGKPLSLPIKAFLNYQDADVVDTRHIFEVRGYDTTSW